MPTYGLDLVDVLALPLAVAGAERRVPALVDEAGLLVIITIMFAVVVVVVVVVVVSL